MTLPLKRHSSNEHVRGARCLILVQTFVYVSCVQTAKALMGLHVFALRHESSLFAYALRTISTCVSSFIDLVAVSCTTKGFVSLTLNEIRSVIILHK